MQHGAEIVKIESYQDEKDLITAKIDSKKAKAIDLKLKAHWRG